MATIPTLMTSAIAKSLNKKEMRLGETRQDKTGLDEMRQDEISGGEGRGEETR